MPTPLLSTPPERHVVLRARIGADLPAGVSTAMLEDRISAVVEAAVAELSGSLDVLQIDLAAHPSWRWFGPVNKITGGPLV